MTTKWQRPRRIHAAVVGRARHANLQVTATIYAGLAETSREQLASKLAKAFR